MIDIEVLTKEKYNEFVKAYETSKANGEEEFVFYGQVITIPLATYLLTHHNLYTNFKIHFNIM
mgnify:CR=1 FL=1|tara:strand:- start:222 stop:410 length:189 start_codon:yes stop_codon:yes gene_type:complete